MKILGITGSSGSGKTTVSELIGKKYSSEIINADKVVKEMSVPGTEYMKKIEEKFGKDILLEDGFLNKKMLADKIYHNKQDLEALNELTFKYVVDEIKSRVTASQNVDYIVIDAPLLIESGLDKLCDYIISVIADENIKIKRICQRDNLDEVTARKRLKIQNENKYYTEKSDFVILNNEDCDLEKEIEEIINQIEK